jgi:hypothetical protein
MSSQFLITDNGDTRYFSSFAPLGLKPFGQMTFGPSKMILVKRSNDSILVLYVTHSESEKVREQSSERVSEQERKRGRD